MYQGQTSEGPCGSLLTVWPDRPAQVSRFDLSVRDVEAQGKGMVSHCQILAVGRLPEDRLHIVQIRKCEYHAGTDQLHAV